MSSANTWSGGPLDNGGGVDVDGFDNLRPSSSSGSSQIGNEPARGGEGEGNAGKRKNKVAPVATTSPALWSERREADGEEDDIVRTENGEGGKWEKPKMAESWGEMVRAWPKRTFCIVSNEFCERFSFYGMRTVLTLYTMNVLRYSEDSATMFFNGFAVLCYFSPILGSILADGYIGKFRTIFFLSIFYTLGQILLAFSSAQSVNSSLHPWADILGLVIIGFGTGGIKPCVAAFGGDQFEPHQEKMISVFFSAFYFSINSGALISTFISPIFRATPCLGQDSCYPLAFGVPALLMIVATVVFMSGSLWYNKKPPKENVFGEVFRASKKAIVNKCHSEYGHAHWLDHYFDTHSCAFDPKCHDLQRRQHDRRACQKRQFIDDVKGLLRLLIMFLPFPMFWALYDQQGSRWLIQSVAMDCRLWGGYMLLPDQMQTLNAVLILVFIPIFQTAIYPLVSRCFKITPLRKMIAGGFIAALAFVVSAAVQFKVNESLPDIPQSGHAFVSAINAFPAPCNMSICANDGTDCRVVLPGQALNNLDRSNRQMFELAAGTQQWEIEFGGDEKCTHWGKKWNAKWELAAGSTYWMMINGQGVLFGKAGTKKPTDGTSEFSIGITLALDETYTGSLALCRKQPSATAEHPCDPTKVEDFYAWEVKDLVSTADYQDILPANHKASIYAFKTVRTGEWALYLLDEQRLGKDVKQHELKVQPTGAELSITAQGGVYMMALSGSRIAPIQHSMFQVVPDNRVSILWQVPQIAIITAAEILFSITGIEFAYSQAAPSMKSLVQALWLLTTSIGDLTIVLITLYKFPNMAIEFLFYAVGMVLVTIVLALLSVFHYDYNYYTGEDASSSTDDGRTDKGDGNNDDDQSQGWSGQDGGGQRRKSQMVQMYGEDGDGVSEQRNTVEQAKE